MYYYLYQIKKLRDNCNFKIVDKDWIEDSLVDYYYKILVGPRN